MSNPLQPQNLLDRMVEALFPSMAARRYQSRASIEMARASYRGAVSTRGSTPWGSSVSYRGGTSSDRRDLAEMRDRARTIYRDNAIAKSLLNTETDNVVAEGYTLQMGSGDTAFNKEAEDRFYRWLDKADVSGKASASDLFRMSWREPRKDGDGGIILSKRGGYPRLQYIPGDLIRNPYAGFDFRTMFDGVECDPAGRAIRFWVRDVDEAGKDIVSPIDARDFVYIAHLDDPMAARGATVFGPVFELLDQIDSYRDSVTKAAIMACICSGWSRSGSTPLPRRANSARPRTARGCSRR
jgi:capsid protein